MVLQANCLRFPQGSRVTLSRVKDVLRTWCCNINTVIHFVCHGNARQDVSQPRTHDDNIIEVAKSFITSKLVASKTKALKKISPIVISFQNFMRLGRSSGRRQRKFWKIANHGFIHAKMPAIVLPPFPRRDG